MPATVLLPGPLLFQKPIEVVLQLQILLQDSMVALLQFLLLQHQARPLPLQININQIF